jgi:predicted Kef-type K+ transport protein
MVQRVSGVFLQWVSLLGSPAIFWGIACFILSFLIPWVVEELSKEEKKELAKGSWIVIWLGAMAGAVYFCNTLTFYTPGI